MDIEETELWREKPERWVCPGCMRSKADCEVVSSRGITLRKLVEHHDHMRNYVKGYLKEAYGSWAEATERASSHPEFSIYMDSIKSLAERFKHTAVCLDCNEVEGKVKRAIGADKYFSFHVHEIRRAFKTVPNQRHVFLDENMPFYERLYAQCRERLVDERKRVIATLIDQAVSNHVLWGGAIKLEAVFDEDVLQRQYPEFKSSTEQKERLQKGEPVRYFSTWTKTEVEEMLALLGQGLDVKDVARSLGRTTGAILKKLETVNLEAK